MKYSKSDLELIKSKIDIVEFLESRGINMKQTGANYVGLCPVHDERSPSFNVRPLQGSFHCLAGETRVLTDKGTFPISELAGGTHKILGAKGRWLEAPFYSFGEQKLYRIELSRNRQIKEIFATDEHRWFVKAGKKRDERREVLTKDLKPEHRLVSVHPYNLTARTTLSPQGVQHGIVYGDGTRAGQGSMVSLHSEVKAKLQSFFPLNPNVGIETGVRISNLPGYYKELPSLEESFGYLMGWLAGYFATDGHIAKDGTVMLNSAKKADLQTVRDICTKLGIKTYGITNIMRKGYLDHETPLYRVHIVGEDLTEKFFIREDQRKRFLKMEKSFVRSGWVVKSVTETDRVEEVFCAVVEDGHAFVLEDNILTGNCFGCGASGDIFTLIQEMDKLTFAGAVEELADIAGVELVKQEEDEEFKKRKRLQEITSIASAWFRQNFLRLPADHPAKQNLESRRLLEGENGSYAADHDPLIGFAPAKGLLDILFKARYSLDEVLSAGLAKKDDDNKTVEVFRNRLLWTVTDVQGKPIGFSGRRIYEDSKAPKYLNSPQTLLYNKSQTLLNLAEAKKPIIGNQEVYIVEGQTDVMALKAAGMLNVVATCGTAFGSEHASILMRLSSIGKDSDKFKIVFCFDGDAAGVKAAKTVFEKNDSILLNSFVVRFPESDPCDYRLNHGDESLVDLVAGQRVSLIEFILREETNSWDMNTVEGQAGYVARAKTILQKITNPVQYSGYLRKVSYWTGISFVELSNMASPSSRMSNTEITPPVTTANSIEGRVMAATLQYPDVMLDLWVEHNLTPEMFGRHAELATRVRAMAIADDIDLRDEKIARLMHLDLGVSSELTDEKISEHMNRVVKQLLQTAYLKEASTINGRLAGSADSEGKPLSDGEALKAMLAAQDELRERYSLKRPTRRKAI